MMLGFISWSLLGGSSVRVRRSPGLDCATAHSRYALRRQRGISPSCLLSLPAPGLQGALTNAAYRAIDRITYSRQSSRSGLGLLLVS